MPNITGDIVLIDGEHGQDLVNFINDLTKIEIKDANGIILENQQLVSVLKATDFMKELIGRNPQLCAFLDGREPGLAEGIAKASMENFKLLLPMLTTNELERILSEKPHYIRFIENPDEILQMAATKNEPDALLLIKKPCDKAQMHALFAKPELLRKMAKEGIVLDDSIALALAKKHKVVETHQNADMEKVMGSISKVWEVSDLANYPLMEDRPKWHPLHEEQYEHLKSALANGGGFAFKNGGNSYLLICESGKATLLVEQNNASLLLSYYSEIRRHQNFGNGGAPEPTTDVQKAIVKRLGIGAVSMMANPCK